MLTKSILDPTFRYTDSASTDVRKTFARIRRELAKQRPEASGNVTPLPVKAPARKPIPIVGEAS